MEAYYSQEGYKALKNKKLKVDSYGCGDSFAAGILYGMASKLSLIHI